MILYNVGDSYTCSKSDDEYRDGGDWCPNQEDHYWYKIGQLYKCKLIINDSMLGRSNNMIIQLATKHCLENLEIPSLYIINTTNLFRFDLNFKCSHLLHNILKEKALADLDFETIEFALYAQLIGLIELLKAKKHKFLIINNKENYSESSIPICNSFTNYIKNEPRVLNWFDNSRVWFHKNVSKIKPVDYKKYSWNGHDNPQGHQKYFEMLAQRIKNRNLL